MAGMGRTRVRRRRVVAALAAAGVLAGFAGPAARIVQAEPRVVEPREAEAARRYVVRPGDTVWSIAAAEVGETEDPRALVDAILSVNGAEAGRLMPGQTLIIPVG